MLPHFCQSFQLFYSSFFLFNMPEEQKAPQITEGEFPFVVEYEMNGETHVIQDTVVCKFIGYDHSSLWLTKPRSWHAYLKGNDEDKCIVFQEENQYSVLEPNRINEVSKVKLNYGEAAYYMGDKINANGMIYAKPFFYYAERYAGKGNTTYNTGIKLSEKELENYFGIKVTRFEFSKPIHNKFR